MTQRMKPILSLLLLLSLVAIAVAEPPKNIVLILADDLGWVDTTLYGRTSLYETPNIERLASRGMTFTKAYAASPICSPTRASIMTGQNPARHGITAPAAHLPDVRFDPIANTTGPPHQKCTNVKSATRLDPSLPTLGKVLQEAGYATAHFGKWHLGREPHSPLELGFEVDIPHWYGPGPAGSYLAPWSYPNFTANAPGEHIEDRMANEAVAWLKKRDAAKPFFLNYWQFSVHAPFGAKPNLIERYRRKIGRGATQGDSAQGDSAQGESVQQSPTYAAMVHSLDDAVGSLLDALDAEQIADETAIVFYSDNGGNIHCGLEETDVSGESYITAITSNHPLRGGKGGIHDGGLRVPAIVVWPGVTEPGSRSDVRIQSTDLYPTILGMLQLERPEGHVIDGVDFARALRGEDMDRGPMFTLVPGHGNTPQWLPPSMAVHHEDWKLIRTFHYGEEGRHNFRLYNLREDIGESSNLASVYPQKVNALDRLMEDYIDAANVVVPLPNPNFDPNTFDASKIGVQAGGLKMPPAPRTAGKARSATPVNKASMQGWIARGSDVSVQSGSLRFNAIGRQPFLANAKVRANGPVEARLRIRASADGTARFQWRNEGQERFPANGQSRSFAVAGGEWQELSVRLADRGRVVHVRLFPPAQKQAVEIDWIEIGPNDGNAKDRQRWDFDGPIESTKAKQKADTVSPPPEAKLTDPQASFRATVQPGDRRPNIVFVLADDLGYGDIEAFGGDRCNIDTPHFDRLCAEGMKFTDAHVTDSVCVPSRTSIMTGRYAMRFGKGEQGGPWGFTGLRFPTTQHTVGEMFQSGGYATGYVGKWHLGTRMTTRDGKVQGPDNTDFNQPIQIGASDYGFDECFFLPGSLDMFPYAFIRGKRWQGNVTAQKGWSAFHRVGPAAEDFVDTKVLSTFCHEAGKFIKTRADQEKPFFLYVALTAPHTPTSPEAEFEGKSRIGIYGDFVMNTDACIGRIRDHLRDAGVDDHTVIMVSSDHGPGHYSGRKREATANQMQEMEKDGHFSTGPWRGYKFSAFEGGLRVPFAVVWPGVVKPGSETEALVGLNDLMATWADIAGIELSPLQAPDSVSFLPVLKDPASRSRDTLVTRGTRADAFRDGQWKLILGPGSGSSGRFYSEPKSEDAWRNAIEAFGRKPMNHKELEHSVFVQLYDLNNDPGETTDLSAENAGRVRKMLADYKKIIRDGRSTPGPQLSNDREVKAFRPPAFVWQNSTN